MLTHFNITAIVDEDDEAGAPNPEALVYSIMHLLDDSTVEQEAVRELLDEGTIIVPVQYSWAVLCALAACGYTVDPRTGIKPALVAGDDELGNRAIPDMFTLKGVSERLWAKGEEGPVDGMFLPAYLTAFGGVAPEDEEDKMKSAILLARAIRALTEGWVHPDLLEACGLGQCYQLSDAPTELTPKDADESA